MANFFKNKKSNKILQDKVDNLNNIDRSKFNVTLVESLILINDFDKTIELFDLKEELSNKIKHSLLKWLMLYVCYIIIVYNSISAIELRGTGIEIDYPEDENDGVIEMCEFSIQEELTMVINRLEEDIKEFIEDTSAIVDVFYNEIDMLVSEIFYSAYIKPLAKFIIDNNITDNNTYDIIPLSIVDYKNNLFRVKMLFVVDKKHNDFIEY